MYRSHVTCNVIIWWHTSDPLMQDQLCQMQLIYVNMQHSHVDMQHDSISMRDNHVNMRLELCCK